MQNCVPAVSAILSRSVLMFRPSSSISSCPAPSRRACADRNGLRLATMLLSMLSRSISSWSPDHNFASSVKWGWWEGQQINNDLHHSKEWDVNIPIVCNVHETRVFLLQSRFGGEEPPLTNTWDVGTAVLEWTVAFSVLILTVSSVCKVSTCLAHRITSAWWTYSAMQTFEHPNNTFFWWIWHFSINGCVQFPILTHWKKFKKSYIYHRCWAETSFVQNSYFSGNSKNDVYSK